VGGAGGVIRPAADKRPRACFTDSHAHYDDKRFNGDRARLLARLFAGGVTGVVNAGADMASSRASVKLAETYSFIYAAVGVHPHDVKDMAEGDIDELKELCARDRVVAVGEIGLDYHYDHSPREAQRDWFARQLALANEVGLPVIIHSREAAADTLSIIKDSPVRRGVLHCYSGHLPMALEYIEMGFFIGVGGVVTYKNAQKTREVIANIPLERLLIETDAPYLPPEPHRGKRNDSSYLVYVVETIAALRGLTAGEVARATADNARGLFGV
jgi:TatD DNase family protein